MWVIKGRCLKSFFGCKKCTQTLGIPTMYCVCRSYIHNNIHNNTQYIHNNCDNIYRNWVRSLRIQLVIHTHSMFLLRLERRDPGVWRCQDCRKIHVFQNVFERELRGEIHKAKVAGEGNIWGSVAGCLQCERQVLSSLWNHAFIRGRRTVRHIMYRFCTTDQRL